VFAAFKLTISRNYSYAHFISSISCDLSRFTLSGVSRIGLGPGLLPARNEGDIISAIRLISNTPPLYSSHPI
jgi:hypothetical protein